MNKLDQIESFGAFLDFLSNPQDYAKLVKDVREAARQHKELVEKKRKIKDIDRWRAEQDAEIERLYSELDKKEEAYLANASGLSDKIKSHKATVTNDNTKLREREEALNLREKAVSSLEKEKAKVVKIKGEYEDKLEAIRREKERLKAQAAQITVLAGNLR